jgi:hypothetical protein
VTSRSPSALSLFRPSWWHVSAAMGSAPVAYGIAELNAHIFHSAQSVGHRVRYDEGRWRRRQTETGLSRETCKQSTERTEGAKRAKESATACRGAPRAVQDAYHAQPKQGTTAIVCLLRPPTARHRTQSTPIASVSSPSAAIPAASAFVIRRLRLRVPDR